MSFWQFSPVFRREKEEEEEEEGGGGGGGGGESGGGEGVGVGGGGEGEGGGGGGRAFEMIPNRNKMNIVNLFYSMCPHPPFVTPFISFGCPGFGRFFW